MFFITEYFFQRLPFVFFQKLILYLSLGNVVAPTDLPPVSVPPTGPQGVPMTPQIPEVWPIVPVIAINKNPVFPKFIKIIEVTEPKLVELLRQKVRLNQPYAGVFVKKDDDNAAELVKDIEELYPIGSFVQIVEMQDLGQRLRMVVMGHRRISLQDRVLDSEPKDEKIDGIHDPVVMVTTENYDHLPYDTTDEVKALTQEIIKTIRDIIVSIFKIFRLCSCKFWFNYLW